MENFETNWTQEELQAYMFLYCAHADFVVTEEEKDFIKSRIGKDDYKAIQKEFNQDNDYQRIQKIDHTISRFNYSKEEIEQLLQNIKNLFLSDGEMDILEQNIFRGLQHLLKTDSL
ncbi:MAG TPA: hypothetical protein VFF21_01260 [Flavobacteriaceae bacterium]|nr:hypothetical protein [Flavobacteriaceae bacterium]